MGFLPGLQSVPALISIVSCYWWWGGGRGGTGVATVCSADYSDLSSGGWHSKRRASLWDGGFIQFWTSEGSTNIFIPWDDNLWYSPEWDFKKMHAIRYPSDRDFRDAPVCEFWVLPVRISLASRTNRQRSCGRCGTDALVLAMRWQELWEPKLSINWRLAGLWSLGGAMPPSSALGANQDLTLAERQQNWQGLTHCIQFRKKFQFPEGLAFCAHIRSHPLQL